jgi:hydroxymethylpyrimidine pyrophosphatase-like HAD family hydrolase
MVGSRRLRIEGRDINPAGTTKATAVTWLCRHLGVPLTAAAAFGDGRNDRDMVATVGRGVAMANAHPSVLAVAACVAPHHDDDGVARVLEEWLSSGSW